MRVLVVGSGGREHCLAWKLAESSSVSRVFCAPGNGGTASVAENVAIDASNIKKICDFSVKEKIDLVVVGPEAPLVEGLVDACRKQGVRAFGPDRELAGLEGSKVFAKQIMKKYGIPTADFVVCDDAQTALQYVRGQELPLVIKADGLAAGKGVFIPSSRKEAEKAIDDIMVKKIFGSAGDRVVIEQCLKGEEASILAITDGTTVLPLVSSQDHKRIYDNDQGPNTGGMGAYAPAPVVNEKVMARIMKDIFNPLIRGLAGDGKIYKGVLYAGLMIENDLPRVLEFNVRFGDPETQVILPKLESDLARVMVQTIDGTLGEVSLQWDSRHCLCVVLASAGYPGKYEKGIEIKGVEAAENRGEIMVFHAGTTLSPGEEKKLVTSGGRVLNVVGKGETLDLARNRVYEVIKEISFSGMQFRHDIGNKALSYYC